MALTFARQCRVTVEYADYLRDFLARRRRYNNTSFEKPVKKRRETRLSRVVYTEEDGGQPSPIKYQDVLSISGILVHRDVSLMEAHSA